VTPLEPGTFRVVVTGGATPTTHRVTVPPGYLEELGVPQAAPEAVVRESFAFLLEREPPTSILSEFDLPEIARFFPSYSTELPRRL
jgi:hypothetical protein